MAVALLGHPQRGNGDECRFAHRDSLSARFSRRRRGARMDVGRRPGDGGVSASRVVATPEGLEFSGVVSLANNGGFASIRARPRAHDLAGTTALLVRVRGDGQTYKLALRTDEAFDGVQYQAQFATRAGEWIEVVMPMTDFQPTFRGRRVETPALDPGRIRGFGLLIADRQAGPFRLVVESIRARF